MTWSSTGKTRKRRPEQCWSLCWRVAVRAAARRRLLEILRYRVLAEGGRKLRYELWRVRFALGNMHHKRRWVRDSPLATARSATPPHFMAECCLPDIYLL
jgi:hypothetical protein